MDILKIIGCCLMATILINLINHHEDNGYYTNQISYSL